MATVGLPVRFLRASSPRQCASGPSNWQLLQVIRILKNYDFFKEPQFGGLRIPLCCERPVPDQKRGGDQARYMPFRNRLTDNDSLTIIL
jgi:hypothetical protein